MLLKVTYKTAGVGPEGDSEIKFLCGHYVGTKHAIFLSIIVGKLATQTTAYAIMTVEFISTVYNGIKLVYKQNKNGLEITESK